MKPTWTAVDRNCDTKPSLKMPRTRSTSPVQIASPADNAMNRSGSLSASGPTSAAETAPWTTWAKQSAGGCCRAVRTRMVRRTRRRGPTARASRRSDRRPRPAARPAPTWRPRRRCRCGATTARRWTATQRWAVLNLYRQAASGPAPAGCGAGSGAGSPARLPNSAASGMTMTIPTSPAAARKTSTSARSAKLPAAIVKQAAMLRCAVPRATTRRVSAAGPPSR
jgi:hypothetical protein